MRLIDYVSKDVCKWQVNRRITYMDREIIVLDESKWVRNLATVFYTKLNKCQFELNIVIRSYSGGTFTRMGQPLTLKIKKPFYPCNIGLIRGCICATYITAHINQQQSTEVASKVWDNLEISRHGHLIFPN